MHQRILASASLLCSWAVNAQPTVKQDSKNSPCSNIVALSGTLTVNCSSLTPAQKRIIEGIPALLNKILANQLDPSAVMDKLDEILRHVNPNLPSKAYFCNGGYRTQGISANAGLSISMNADPDPSLQPMLDMANSQRWGDLIKSCTVQLDKNREWLTPYLLCSLGYANMNELPKAREMLKKFEDSKGPAYDSEPCTRIIDILRNGFRKLAVP